MPADTPILGLKQYDSMEDMDYNDINGDNLALDSLPPTICTSSTRPGSNLYFGRYIWETDTKKLSMWDGTAWQIIAHNDAWEPYTPTWSASGTQPVIGNGSLTGRWKQIGKTVHYFIKNVIGSTTSGGTGTQSYILPVNLLNYNGGTPCGNAVCSKGGVSYMGMCVQVSGQGVGVIDLHAVAGTRWTNTVPVSLASGDYQILMGTYESV